MAEVIKPPTAGKWAYEYTCKSKWCGATIRAFIEDVHVGEFGGAYCERGDTKYYTPCPVCGELHFIPDKDVSPKAAEMADKKRRD
jgi:hypothetical protein